MSQHGAQLLLLFLTHIFAKWISHKKNQRDILRSRATISYSKCLRAPHSKNDILLRTPSTILRLNFTANRRGDSERVSERGWWILLITFGSWCKLSQMDDAGGGREIDVCTPIERERKCLYAHRVYSVHMQQRFVAAAAAAARILQQEICKSVPTTGGSNNMVETIRRTGKVCKSN